MSGLMEHDDGGGAARCAFCHAEAAGPCASCHTPVCGACCTLTEGTSRPWAICLDCDRKKGKSLGNAWRGFGGFLVALLLVLALLVGLLRAMSGSG